MLEVKMCFIMFKYYGYSPLYNANHHRLTCKMYDLLQRKRPYFLSWNFHSVLFWGANSYTMYSTKFLSQGAVKNFERPQLTKVNRAYGFFEKLLLDDSLYSIAKLAKYAHEYQFLPKFYQYLINKPSFTTFTLQNFGLKPYQYVWSKTLTYN